MTSFPELRAPSVTVRARHRSIHEDGFVVEIDPRLPDAVVGRTVYHATNERYLGPPHRHDAPHELMCLAGVCALGWAPGPSGPVTWSELGPGDALYVPGTLTHRLWLGADSILASIASSTSWLATNGFEEFPADGWWWR